MISISLESEWIIRIGKNNGMEFIREGKGIWKSWGIVLGLKLYEVLIYVFIDDLNIFVL
jgi:hypothetical protein